MRAHPKVEKRTYNAFPLRSFPSALRFPNSLYLPGHAILEWSYYYDYNDGWHVCRGFQLRNSRRSVLL
jgi:hypothetical protein